jgi:hypothetical protein
MSGDSRPACSAATRTIQHLMLEFLAAAVAAAVAADYGAVVF